MLACAGARRPVRSGDVVARRVAGRDMDGQAQAGMRRRCRRLLGALRRGAASCELKKKKKTIDRASD